MVVDSRSSRFPTAHSSAVHRPYWFGNPWHTRVECVCLPFCVVVVIIVVVVYVCVCLPTLLREVNTDALAISTWNIVSSECVWRRCWMDDLLLKRQEWTTIIGVWDRFLYGRKGGEEKANLWRRRRPSVCVGGYRQMFNKSWSGYYFFFGTFLLSRLFLSGDVMTGISSISDLT